MVAKKKCSKDILGGINTDTKDIKILERVCGFRKSRQCFTEFNISFFYLKGENRLLGNIESLAGVNINIVITNPNMFWEYL